MRKTRLHTLAAASIAMFAAGCSVYPTPDDLTRASTFDIVQRIRCEAKAGLTRFHPNDAHAQKIIAATTIGYDFNFEITEINDAAGGILQTVRPPAVTGNTRVSVDVSGGATRRRTNTRRLEFIEDLTELAAARCSSTDVPRNGLYPITGTLGVDEVVSTYLQLEKLSDLKRTTKFSTGLALGGKVPVFADTLTFRTKVGVGATPRLQLSAVSGNLKITNASVVANASRDDLHDLIIVLARDEGDIDPQTRLARNLRQELIDGRLANGDPRTETALVQRNAERRTRTLLEMKRLRNLKDDEKEAPRYLGEKLLEFLKPPQTTQE